MVGLAARLGGGEVLLAVREVDLHLVRVRVRVRVRVS